LNPPSESSNYSRTAPPEEEKSVFIFWKDRVVNLTTLKSRSAANSSLLLLE
jgi:hypothetical protein